MDQQVRIHGTEAGIQFQLHGIVGDVDDQRLFVVLPDQDRGALDAVQKLLFVDGNLCLVIAGEHLADAKILALDQTRDHDGTVKLKQDMVGAEVDEHLLFVIAV